MRTLLLIGCFAFAACAFPFGNQDDAPAKAKPGGVSAPVPTNVPAGSPGGPPPPPSASNMARFTLDCDLNGMNGVLTMDVEAIDVTGAVFGPGANPDITGVIGTGEFTYVTAGELVSSVAHYVFTGRNDFADFTELGTYERFRVQWLLHEGGLTMLVNPFGPGPATHDCVTTSARYL